MQFKLAAAALGFLIVISFVAVWSLSVMEDTPLAVSPVARMVPPTPKASVPSSPASNPVAPAPQPVLPAQLNEAEAEPGERPTGTGVLVGEVVDGLSGEPAGIASITLTYVDSRASADPHAPVYTWMAESTADGKFVVSNLQTITPYQWRWSRYRVLARAGDRVGVATVNLSEEEPEGYAKVELWKGAPIAGRVVDEEGKGIPGVLLTPELVEDRRKMQGGASLRIESDSEGGFEAPGLPEGRWKFRVEALEHAGTVSDPVATGTTDMVVTLTKGGQAAGKVILVPGEVPVGGITVIASALGLPFKQVVTSDKAGDFQLTHLAKGTYGLEIEDETHALMGSTPSVTIKEGSDTPDLKVTVCKGGVVSGKVYDKHTGEPLAGVLIVSDKGRHTGAVSDAAGNYSLAGLIPGVHTLVRQSYKRYRNGERRADKQVSLALGQVVEGIDFAMELGVSVRGKVVDEEGKPIARAQVQSQSSGGDGESAATKSASDGTFELRGHAPNSRIEIVARAEGYARAEEESLTLQDSEVREMRLVLAKGASIEGVLLNRAGQPLDHYNLYLSGRTRRFEDRSDTGAGGKFKYGGLPPDDYVLKAGPPDGGEARVDVGEVSVAALQEVKGVRLVYAGDDDSPKISGRVVDETGEPLARIHVDAEYDFTLNSSREQHRTSAITQDDGRFELKGLRDAEYSLIIRSAAYSTGTVEGVAAGTTNVKVVVRRKGRIEGIVLGPQGPLESFEVVAGAELANLHQVQYTPFFDPGGKFTLENVEGPEVTVAARAPGFMPGQVRVRGVGPDNTVTGVKIQLQPGATVKGHIVDGAGAPVGNANITYTLEAEASENNSNGYLRSQEDGSFSIDSLAPGRLQIDVIHQDYLAHRSERAIHAGVPAVVDIKLDAGVSVEGTVYLGTTPAAGALVHVFPEDPQPDHLQSAKRATSDAKGHYQINGLLTGNYRAEARYSREGARYNTQLQFTTAETGVTQLDVAFAGGTAALEGRVTVNGVPSGPGIVMLFLQEQQNTMHCSLEQDGTYSITGLPPGAVTVNVGLEQPVLEEAPGIITLVDGITVRHDVQLQGAVRVKGRLLGPPNAQLVLLEGNTPITVQNIKELHALEGGFQPVTQARVLPGGDFHLPNLAPGTYTVGIFSSPDDNLAATSTVTIWEGMPETLEIDVR